MMPDALVLIIDDNAMNRKLARDLLQHAGYRTLQAATAMEGIELARAHLPDLVLLDVQLPDMDGVEALRRIRDESGLVGTPAVAFTAFAMRTDRDRFLAAAAGFDGYLAKPIEVRRFVEQVGGYCVKRRRSASVRSRADR